MKKRGKGRGTPWVLIVVVAVLAVLAGYMWGAYRTKETDKPPAAGPGRIAKKATPAAEEAGPLRKEILREEEGKPEEAGEDECKRLQEAVRGFFTELNGKPHIREITEGTDTYVWFRRMLKKLSDNPPVPAGEGLDPTVMTSNVYHFFSLLDRREMKLLKAVLTREPPALETSMHLFFRWLSMGNRCPQPEGIRPSRDTLYAYAGFFLNTVGGRAYLFRRPSGLRLLGTYYCLLILHEADEHGRNRDGIDLAPHLVDAAREIGFYGDFLYQKEYVRRLDELRAFYAARR
ncbi:MAG: hypothetical protein JXL84_11840 [Deltaproteobacteria bacterium]|nr:hypothetical protein [Deltaproteobacteria bacterium]